MPNRTPFNMVICSIHLPTKISQKCTLAKNPTFCAAKCYQCMQDSCKVLTTLKSERQFMRWTKQQLECRHRRLLEKSPRKTRWNANYTISACHACLHLTNYEADLQSIHESHCITMCSLSHAKHQGNSGFFSKCKLKILDFCLYS